jgi:hypothetical protein
MSPAEARHRLTVSARRRLLNLPWAAMIVERDDPWVARLAADPAVRAGLPTLLAHGLGRRLYGDGWSPTDLARNLTAAGVSDRIVAEARQIRAHRLRVLAYGECELGEPIDWHRDPVSGRSWPRQHGARAARGEATGLDPKLVWEVNRHQHFEVLAAAAALTRDMAFADEVADQLAGWIDQNPAGQGIHWTEATEPSARILAWLWALPLVLDSARFSPEFCLRMLRALVSQARHVAANLSVYSSPNTHLLFEALALFVAGTALPDLAAATAWQERGRTILEREITAQVGDDGFYREASTYYHAYAVEFYLLAVVIAERNGVTLAPAVREGLGRLVEAMAWMVRPDGTLPNVGDADGGRALRLGAPHFVRVDELLASGAIVTGRPELRAGLEARGEEAAWLWPDALERLRRLGPATPPRGGRQFPDAGLAIERHRLDDDERWALFDASDLGMLAGGHGHAGCLGVSLYANHRPLIVDRGTYVYNAAPGWRTYFRGTRAHSTVVIDGVDQAQVGTTNFRWATRYRSRLVRYLTGSDYALVTGEHDGYRRLPQPVGHRRTLLSVGAEYWLCIDAFTGTGTHDAEFLFHLAPGLEVEARGASIFAVAPDADDGLLVTPVGFATGVESRVMCGQRSPLQGWHSEDYGDCRPAPTVSTTDRLRMPAVRAHVLAPATRAAETHPIVDAELLTEGLTITVRKGDTTDVVLCSPDEPRLLVAAGVAFLGELLHARFDSAGRLRRFLAVRARSVAWNGDALMGTENPADWMVSDGEQLFVRG